LYELLDPTT